MGCDIIIYIYRNSRGQDPEMNVNPILVNMFYLFLGCYNVLSYQLIRTCLRIMD